jgi:amidase
VTDVGALHCFVPGSRPVAATSQGALDSARIALKDLFAVAGHTSSFGSARWRETHGPSDRNAPVVAALLEAGASIAGLAKMDQLAYSLIGNAGEGPPPVNPFDPECFAGGSSSGSASAVAGGVADLGVGTDTAGSIRVPAAACGLHSVRPSHGRISTEGVIPLAPSLDVVGFLGRDAETILAALTTVSPRAASRFEVGRVRVPRGLERYTDGGTATGLGAAARRMGEALGCEVEEIDIDPFVSAGVGDLFARVQGREIWSEHADWVRANIGALAADVQARLRRCETLASDPAGVVRADLSEREAYAARLADLLADSSVMVLPVLPRRGPLMAWSGEELLRFRSGCFRLTAPSSLGRAPQVVFPGRHGETLFAGSVLGPSGRDDALIEIIGGLARDGGRVSV